MIIDFFIKRPIFTSVCSFIIILAGLICIPMLPVSQYPQLAPPMVTLTSVYTGASSEPVETAVTTPLEQAINGVEGMKYITSQSGNDGTSTIQVTFNLERDKDLAAVDVQNSISNIMATLPDEVQRTGVTISKQSTAIVSSYAFYCDNEEYDNVYISNYVEKYILDDIKRIPGVGGARIAGQRKYSMRVWLDPMKLAARDLTATDVVNVINEQNVQVPAGMIGNPPNMAGQKFQFSIKVHGRLSKPEEFDNLVLKTNPDGSLVKIKDVGYSEIGSEDYSTNLIFNKKPGVGLMIYQLADANSLQLFTNIAAKVDELSKDFPPGLKVKLAFETTSVVKDSIKEVVITLFISICLVVAVIFLFLQSWRTTLIPVITIPVSLIGTFAILKLAGFSINTLSLFGIVLATGLVVDDAIVVIENIQRNISEKGLSPIKAASEGMKDVTGAVIASTLVLAAVFLPVAAFPGTTGQLYKQFALTIVFSVSISLFNALTLTPALSGLLLSKEEHKEGGFFKRVNNVITSSRDKYHGLLAQVLKYKPVVVIVFLVMMGLTFYLLNKVPGGFVPSEDQGYFITTIQAPEGVSLDYTTAAMREIENMIHTFPEVTNTFVVAGYSFNGNGPNKGLIFTTLKPIDERKGIMQSARVLALKLNKQLLAFSDATAITFEPPPIQGIGNVGGFQFELLDTGGHTLDELSTETTNMIANTKKSPVLQGLYSSFTSNSPQLMINIDRDKAKLLGVPLNNLFSTLQVFLGSKYINDFDLLDRVYRVYVQADKVYRDNPDDINKFYVRSESSGKMIPLANLANVKKQLTAQTITHYNLFRSSEINGSQAQGYSSGQALEAMQQIANTSLPRGMTYQWSGISLEQIQAGKAGILMFALGLLLVYLVLAAQYESLIDPLVIILAVPLAVFGALLAQWARGLENDVFCQIGLVMLIGLACKNSILIVEFANQLMEKGSDSLSAVMEAAKTRFRPIMMTSFAFILGIFPLVIATGAGAASRNSMGTAVFGGMFISTFLSLFIVPVLFLIAKYFCKKVHFACHKDPQ